MVILGLGCNIGDRLANLRVALKHLRNLPTISILQISPLYESDALLPENAEPFWDMPYLNLALSIDTKLLPEQLLSKLKKIEHKMGRAEHLHWSPRIIDIDILAWEEKIIETENLQIPHAGLLERPFALWPLADVAPLWRYPKLDSNQYDSPAHIVVKKWGSKFGGNAPLHTKQIAHRIDTPEIMGILNVTPDSFSDGGAYNATELALEHAVNMFVAGADIIDIGGESTRPRAQLLSPDEEWQRLEPILQGLNSIWPSNTFCPKISVDTRHAKVAKKALQYRIDYLNDVSGITTPEMQHVALNSAVKLIFMHNLGVPPSADKIIPDNQDYVASVLTWAEKQLEQLTTIGINKERLIFDVGIGFGKSALASLELLQRITEFYALKIPILVGHSRKSFLALYTDKIAAERDIETLVFSEFLANKNIDYLRVHNVDWTMRALRVSKQLKIKN